MHARRSPCFGQCQARKSADCRLKRARVRQKPGSPSHRMANDDGTNNAQLGDVPACVRPARPGWHAAAGHVPDRDRRGAARYALVSGLSACFHDHHPASRWNREPAKTGRHHRCGRVAGGLGQGRRIFGIYDGWRRAKAHVKFEQCIETDKYSDGSIYRKHVVSARWPYARTRLQPGSSL